MFCLAVWKEIPAHNFRVLQVILFKGVSGGFQVVAVFPPATNWKISRLQVKNSLAKSSGPNLLSGQRFQNTLKPPKPTKNDPKCFIQLLEFFPFRNKKTLTVFCFASNFHPSKLFPRIFVAASSCRSFSCRSHSRSRAPRKVACTLVAAPTTSSENVGAREMLKVCGRRSFPRRPGGGHGCCKKNMNRPRLFRVPVSQRSWLV